MVTDMWRTYDVARPARDAASGQRATKAKRRWGWGCLPNCSRPLLLPATLMSWNWTRQSLIPKGNESYLELKSVLTMTTNYASRFTLLFSVALETSRAGMVCECRNNRSIAVRVRRPSAGAGGAARIGGASFAKLIHSVPSLPPPKRPFSNAPLPLSVA